MLGKKISSFKNLAKKTKVRDDIKRSHSEKLLAYGEEKVDVSSSCSSPFRKPPAGFVALYVGEERCKFVVPMGYLTHPLFKMMLEKSSEEFGFNQKNGLVVPCNVDVFRDVVSVVESCNGKCDLRHLVEELI